MNRAGRRDTPVRRRMSGVRAAVAVLLLAAAGPALGQPKGGPDWPCIQRKVPELSPAAVWSGPPVDAAAEADPQTQALAEQIAARRMPMEEAEAAIAKFAAGLPAGRKEAVLTALFSAVFRILDSERAEIIAGIERYGRKQQQFAEAIRSGTLALETLRQQPNADRQEIDRRTEEITWQTRIFNERRASLSFVCEVPTLIEQRFFLLARAIQNALVN